jgi:hypothetical protein
VLSLTEVSVRLSLRNVVAVSKNLSTRTAMLIHSVEIEVEVELRMTVANFQRLNHVHHSRLRVRFSPDTLTYISESCLVCRNDHLLLKSLQDRLTDCRIVRSPSGSVARILMKSILYSLLLLMKICLI